MENNPTYLFVVAAALVDDDGKILVQKRPENKALPGLWEFPGGKVERGETPEAALIRELAEELALEVELDDLIPLTFASEPLGERHLLLLLYVCRRWSGEPVSQLASDLLWLPADDLAALEMPPADGPLVEYLSRHL